RVSTSKGTCSATKGNRSNSKESASAPGAERRVISGRRPLVGRCKNRVMRSRRGDRPSGVWSAFLVVLIGALFGSPAAAGAATWSRTQLPGPAEKIFLLGVSCPSPGLCVAVGTDNLIASSTNPDRGASAWHYGYAGEGPWPKTEDWPAEFISGKQVQSVSC